MKPLEDRNIASTEFLSVHDTRMGLAVCRTTLDKIVLNEQAKPSTSDMASCYEKEQVELLPPTCITSGFDEPLYPISHPWNAIGRLNAIPLFFLTNKLSEEQTRALYEEIQTMNHIDDDDWGKKIICPVPWKEDEPDAEDGTPADMWRIYTEVDDSCELPLVFADQQSGEDLRIIMTDKIYVSYALEDEEACELLKGVKDPAHCGITYGRLPGRDAHITWVNLNIANMDIDESFNDENQCENYLRPDWPCHDRVGEYNEWVPRGGGEGAAANQSSKR